MGTHIDCNQVPTDAISRLRFNHNDKSLLATSWDGGVHWFNPYSGEPQDKLNVGSALLDGVWLKDNRSVVVGGLDGQLTMVDSTHKETSVLGTHDAAIRAMCGHLDTNLVFSGGWDGKVLAYDTKSRVPVASLSVPGRVYCMDASGAGTKLCVGLDSRTVQIYDIRSMEEPIEIRDNLMKFQLRSLACHPGGRGYVAGSTEGKVAWEFFEGETPPGQKSYVFKCHREKFTHGGEAVWPVNCLAFHPAYGTFATGGSDGTVNIWDGKNRKRLWRLPQPMLTSVTSVSLSGDDRLAIGVSYDYTQGPQPPPRPSHNATDTDVLSTIRVVIRNMRREEVEPKSKV